MNHIYSLLLCVSLSIFAPGFSIDASGADTKAQATGSFTGKKL